MHHYLEEVTIILPTCRLIIFHQPDDADKDRPTAPMILILTALLPPDIIINITIK